MNSLVALSLATLAVLAGCHQGGPGIPNSGEDEKPFSGQAENTLNLDVPVTSSSLRQGEATVATVGIKRGKNFNQDSFTLRVPNSTTLKQGEEQAIFVGIKRDKTFNQDVALRFSELPQGITHQPATPIIKQLSTEVKVVFTAVEDASLGDFGIQVTGHPAKGTDASHKFKLTVAVNE